MKDGTSAARLTKPMIGLPWLVGATNQHSQNKHNLNKRYLGECAENRNDASAVIARAVWVCAHKVHLRRNVARHEVVIESETSYNENGQGGGLTIARAHDVPN